MTLHAACASDSDGPIAGVERLAPAVARLSLCDFRNYAELRLDLAADFGAEAIAGPIVLTGPNGAGKTNLLEALSFLAPGRGLRGCRLDEASRHGVDAWAVAATLAGGEGALSLGTGISRAVAAERDADDDIAEDEEADGDERAERAPYRRSARIDGENARPADFAEHLSLVWLTPAMDRLFLGAAGHRRRLLDQLVLTLHPAHGRELSACDRALRERLRLLIERGPGADAAWLAALEHRIAEHGVAVAAARVDTIDHLAAFAGASDKQFPRASLAVDGIIEAALRERPALAVEDDFRRMLRDGRAADARRKQTGTGPHRSDLLLHHVEKDQPARLCSTGEQKLLLTGLLLAHAEMLRVVEGAPPILLLDEVAAHLDAEHRAALFARVLDLGCQAWMTGTDVALFDSLGGGVVRLQVGDGRVTPLG